ncbi:MAG: phosphate ABC transporter substrate-binding protein [Alphaproteobacteria bacterium]|nr:phosphate ABC transporter substrate-binding protein [Alphaproteobacteria bacterium]
MKHVVAAASVLLLALSAAADAQPKAPGKISTEGLDMQAARARMMTRRGRMVAYTKRWDLSALPHYRPRRKITGTIRLAGSNYITDGPLGAYWAAAFARFQPGARIAWDMRTAFAAVPALAFKASDIGIGRKVTFAELELFERYANHDPVEVTIATGSYDVPGWNPGFGIVVNADNPISKITMDQLDGIFGAERSGGWEGTSWRPQYARGPEKNIRTWGQLGLTGAWADKPIHVYGLNLRYHQATEMSDKILRGSDKWNEQLRVYANYVSKDGKLERGLNDDLAADKYGIAYIAAPTTTLTRDRAVPHLKILKLARTAAGPYVPYTLETLHDRSYPLFDEIYAYADRTPGKPLDPKVVEFLRFMVSQEGQREVMRDGKYLPLTAEVARAQMAKLDALEKPSTEGAARGRSGGGAHQ